MSAPKAARLVPQTQQGVEEFVHVSSFAIIKNGSKILLAKRSRPEYLAGRWTIPSSVINYGEDPEAAMRRVVTELLGVTATSVKLIDVESYGDKHWDICFVYDVAIPNVGKLSPDVDSVDYHDITAFPQPNNPGHVEVIETLRQRKLLG